MGTRRSLLDFLVGNGEPVVGPGSFRVTPSSLSLLISAASADINLQLIFGPVTSPSSVSLHAGSAGSALPARASLHSPRPLKRPQTPFITRLVGVTAQGLGYPHGPRSPHPSDLTQLISFQLPKKLPEQESPQPIPPGNKVRGGVSDGRSGEGSLSHPPGAVPVSAGTPGVAVPSAVSPEQGRDWLSRRPVCVDNGFFGNANHLHRGTPGLALGRSAPSRDAGATHSPGQPRNEPEETSDFSPESPPRLEGATRGVGQQAPNSVPKKQPVPSSGCGEPTSSFVDVRSPLLIQEQFDAEKKLREHPGSAGGFPSWQNQMDSREQEVLLRDPHCKKLGY